MNTVVLIGISVGGICFDYILPVISFHKKQYFFMSGPVSKAESVVRTIFETLARTFPVACASDEFFYFPQIRLPGQQWSSWDDFSPDTIAGVERRLSVWGSEIELLAADENDQAVQIDLSLLLKLVRTLTDQLVHVRTWESQPTFYLTLASIGMAEAMDSMDRAAKHERAKSLPLFLEKAMRNLECIPVLFRDIGLEMLSDTRNYFASLERIVPELHAALTVLNRFEEMLCKVETRKDFRLPADIMERIVRFHINSEMGIGEIKRTIDNEIDEMLQVMERESLQLTRGESLKGGTEKLWLEALKSIPVPDVKEDGLIGLYAEAVYSLAKHCRDKGLVSRGMLSKCPVHVAPMPPYVSAIRSSSSYSIIPEYPPSGGTFYIFNAHAPEERKQENLREYRMLSAHETYPGHHLLDTIRLSLDSLTRRSFEQPIFYEGWACFAEELMSRTGYFSEPGDRLLLAKRRLWRALRAKVDLGLQTGDMDVRAAAAFLTKTGMSIEEAVSAARKYSLNPGYQLCYTLGLRRFLDLFDQYGSDDLQKFVGSVLGEGEIHFHSLENILKQGAAR